MDALKVIILLAILGMLIPISLFASTTRKLFKWLIVIAMLPMAMWGSCTLNIMSHEFYRGSARGFEVSLTHLISLAILIVLMLKNAAGKWYADFGGLCFILYFVLSLPSLQNAESQLYAWFELWKVIMVYVTYRAMRGYLKATGDCISPLIGVGLVAIFNFFSVVKQHFVGIAQAKGVFAHQNSMAMWVLLAGTVFFSAYMNLPTKNLWRFFAFSFVAASAALVRTYSRGAIACYPLTITIVMWFSITKNFNPRMLGRLLPLVLIALLGVALLLPKVIERFENAPPNSGAMRVAFAIAAQNMIMDHPMAGVGINNWGIKINPPYTYSEHREQWRMPPDFKDGIVETIYLLVWAECGTPCFIVLLLFFGWHCVTAFLLIKRLRNTEYFWIVVGIAAGTLGLYMQSVLEWVLKQAINFTELAVCFALVSYLNEMTKYQMKNSRNRRLMTPVKAATTH